MIDEPRAFSLWTTQRCGEVCQMHPRRWYGATPWTCGHGGVGITHGGSRGHGQTDGPVECSGAPGRHYPTRQTDCGSGVRGWKMPSRVVHVAAVTARRKGDSELSEDPTVSAQ